MGVYIKGMEMPTSCYDCAMHKPLYHTSYCAVANRNCTPLREKKAWCPLVPVPPHGDLIDRDALGSFPYNMDFCDGGEADEWVQAASVVIPAEPGGEET